MIDPVAGALQAVALRSAAALPLAFAAGAATSLGPCAAPRYVAVAVLLHTTSRPARSLAAFVAGLCGAYVAVGLAAGAVVALWSVSGYVYAAIAAGLAVAGVVTLARGGDAVAHDCAHLAAGRGGGAFLLGVSSALIVAPCCTPVVAGIAGLTLSAGRSGEGIALLCAFACGHAAPVLAAGALGSPAAALVRRLAAAHAPAMIAGSLMLALAAFYGTLA